MKTARRRIDVNLDELDRVLDGARQAPLSEADHDKLKSRAACPGGDAGAAAQYGEDQRRGWEAGRLSSRNSAGYQRDSAARTRAQWSRGVWRCAEGRHHAPEADARRSLPGVRKRQRVRAEGTEGAGADRGTGAAGGHGVLAGAIALRRLRAGVHGTRAGRRGTGKVRRDGGGDDRATQVRQRNSVLPVGTTGKPAGHSVAGGDAVGDRRGSRGVDQTGAG